MTHRNRINESMERSLGRALRDALDQPVGDEPPLDLDAVGLARAGRARRRRRHMAALPAVALAVAVPVVSVAIVEQLPLSGKDVTAVTPAGETATSELLDTANQAFGVKMHAAKIHTEGRGLTATVTGRDTWDLLAVRAVPVQSCQDYSSTLIVDGGPSVVASCSSQELGNGSTALVWVAAARSRTTVEERVEVRTGDGVWVTVDRVRPVDDATERAALVEGTLRLAASACRLERSEASVSWCTDQG